MELAQVQAHLQAFEFMVLKLLVQENQVNNGGISLHQFFDMLWSVIHLINRISGLSDLKPSP
jgi:hypothetical protein